MRLIADMGGTNVRLAVHRPGGKPEKITTLRVDDHDTPAAAIEAYLARRRLDPPDHAAFAVAGPVTGNRVKFTNSPWSFSQKAIARRFGFRRLYVVNDFTALALGIPHLTRADRRPVGKGAPVRGATIGVLGPGTGLGVSGLVPCGDGYTPLASEGGNVTLAPFDEFEAGILRMLHDRMTHVSAERLLSGSGLSLLYQTIALLWGETVRPTSPETITERALAKTCPICRRAIETFCAMLGTVAGDLALTLGARGGIYVAGGIVPRFERLFARSPFRKRFQTKGRMSGYLSAIPTYVVTYRTPALLGLSTLPMQ